MQIYQYEKGMVSRFDEEYGDEDLRGKIILPHSCDEWVIGDDDDARQLIADLQALLDVVPSE